MRLRPSGRQGPVAASLDAFRNYQLTEAWTWEHLALTRARRVAGCPDLGAEVEAFRRVLLPEKGRRADVRADVAAMRARLAEAKPGDSRWEAKDGPGRLQDIELAAQSCALLAGSHAHRVEAQLLAGRRSGVLDKAAEAALLEAYRLCWRMQCSSRLLADRVGEPQALGLGGQALILRETGAKDLDALAQALQAQAETAARVITELLDSGLAPGQS